MTEREILARQEQAGNREFVLMLVGSFVHAYGHGAFALARATGYRVLRKQRKWGELLTVGFPVGRLDLVSERVRGAGGNIEAVDERTWTFRGIDGTPDGAMISEPQPRSTATKDAPRPSPAQGSWLAEAVRAFNLSMSTPMDAMLFIGTLQQRLEEETHDDNACESPVGHGLQE